MNRVHRSFSIPGDLVDQALKAAPSELGDNLNGLVTLALREFVESRKRASFDKAMSEMAADPALRKQSAQIAKDFESSELDGL